MKRVVMAVIYAVDVLPEETDPQVETFERISHALPEIEGMKILFASPVLAPSRDSDILYPDFDVDVRAHGRTLKPIPYM